MVVGFVWNLNLLVYICKFIDDSVTFYHFSLINSFGDQCAKLLEENKMDEYAKKQTQLLEYGVFKKIKYLPNGKFHGVWELYRCGVVRESTTYKNGKKHGKHVRRNSGNGDLYTIEVYKDDVRESVEYLKSYSIFTDRYTWKPLLHEEGSYRCNGIYDNCSEVPLNCATRRAFVREINNSKIFKK